MLLLPEMMRLFCEGIGRRGSVRGSKKARELTVIVVIAYDYLFWFAVLAHLAPEILVECIKMILQLRGVHFVFRVVSGVLIEIGKEDGLRI